MGGTEVYVVGVKGCVTCLWCLCVCVCVVGEVGAVVQRGQGEKTSRGKVESPGSFPTALSQAWSWNLRAGVFKPKEDQNPQGCCLGSTQSSGSGGGMDQTCPLKIHVLKS